MRAIWLTNQLIQCFETVGWVIRPVKVIVSRMTYTVSTVTLNQVLHNHCNRANTELYSIHIFYLLLTRAIVVRQSRCRYLASWSETMEEDHRQMFLHRRPVHRQHQITARNSRSLPCTETSSVLPLRQMPRDVVCTCSCLLCQLC